MNAFESMGVVVSRVPTWNLRPEETTALRELLRAAWEDDPEDFTDEDWEHAVGGVHFVGQLEGEIVAHASVIERELHTNDLHLRTGYVEAVATSARHRRGGVGTAVMREVGRYIDETFQLGALGTGVFGFYLPLGWVVWQGPTLVRTDAGPVRTPEDDGYVLVRLTPMSPELDLTAPISCDWRPGEVW